MIVSQTVRCPYCGERFESNIDVSAGSEEYREDCKVCCRTIHYTTLVNGRDELLRIEIRRHDD
ncbi:MAG: CPXCG motif-containing cysteine-rich protein [Gammaproteobacteria bacterium]|nr:CPXCG motif-containing cysteine-rich protein [Gammaproteobacteria bacterium]